MEALHNMLQLVGSLENLAGLGPSPGSDYLTGTRGGSPLHRATGRITFSVHGHVRIKRVRGIVHVGRSMSVSTNSVLHHARMDAKLHSRGTDALVVEPCDNILELVGSLEGLAGLGPPL